MRELFMDAEVGRLLHGCLLLANPPAAVLDREGGLLGRSPGFELFAPEASARPESLADPRFQRHGISIDGIHVADLLVCDGVDASAGRLSALIESVTITLENALRLAGGRRRTEENMATQSLILDTIPQSIFWKDAQGRYLGCNSAFAKAAGVDSPAQIVGKTDYELPWARTEAEQYRADDAAVVAGGAPRLHIIEFVQRADGTRMVVDTSKIPLRTGPDAGVEGVLGIYEDITERNRVEQELDRYRTLVDQSSSIVLEWDPEGRILYLNHYGAEFFGFSLTELVGRNVVGTIVPPVDASGVDLRQKMAQVQVNPDEFYSSENENLRKDGKRVWVAWSNRGVYSEDGRLLKTISVGIDRSAQRDAERELQTQYEQLQEEIARRQQAEALLLESHAQLEARVLDRTRELAESNRQLQLEIAGRARVESDLLVEKALADAVINGLPGVFYMYAIDGRLLRWNDEFARRTGLGADQAATHRMLDRIVPADRARAEAAVADALTTGQTAFEARVETIDGERVYRFAARRLQLNNARYLVGSGYDVTEQRAAESRLRESEAKFRVAFMTGAVAFVLVEEASGRLLEVNDRFLDLYGFDRDAVIDRTSLELGLWAEPEARGELLSRLATSGRVENFEVLAQRKDGQRFWVLYSVNRLLLQEQSLLLGAIVDISERKRAESEIAEYASRLEGTLETTLEAVSSMVEMRDPYTAGHERRVGIIAGDIARKLGWKEERCHQLELIGLVHDIGKIAVPAEILTKPGTLTKIEYELVKMHAERGFEILRNVKSSMPIAEVVRQHHERMDGSGYPRGLRGEEILMEARILAVADVVESMASHRPYRPARGMADALDVLERGRGSLFDETVVDVMLAMVRQQGYRMPE